MAWTFSVGQVDVWWDRWRWKLRHESVGGWVDVIPQRATGRSHWLYLPSGVVICWPRHSKAYRQVQRRQRWDVIETWVVRAAVAVGVGVAFGLLLVWLKGQQ